MSLSARLSKLRHDKLLTKAEYQELKSMIRQEGHWIIQGKYAKCADCGKLIRAENMENYCPRCGLKMGGME